MFSDYERQQNLPEAEVMRRAYKRVLSRRRSSRSSGIVLIALLAIWILFSAATFDQWWGWALDLLIFTGWLILMSSTIVLWFRPDLPFRRAVSSVVPELTPKGQKIHDRICGALRSPVKDALLAEINK